MAPLNTSVAEFEDEEVGVWMLEQERIDKMA